MDVTNALRSTTYTRIYSYTLVTKGVWVSFLQKFFKNHDFGFANSGNFHSLSNIYMLKRIPLEEAQYYVYLTPNTPGNMSRAVAFTLTPAEDGGEIVNYYGESIFDPSGGIRKPEWVYVLVNKDIPGVCKIGMTTTSVEQRTREINSATGVISPWFPVYRYKCVNSRYLEQDVHRYLQERGYRVNVNREGFYIDSTTAREVIEQLGVKYQTYSP